MVGKWSVFLLVVGQTSKCCCQQHPPLPPSHVKHLNVVFTNTLHATGTSEWILRTHNRNVDTCSDICRLERRFPACLQRVLVPQHLAHILEG